MTVHTLILRCKRGTQTLCQLDETLSCSLSAGQDNVQQIARVTRHPQVFDGMNAGSFALLGAGLLLGCAADIAATFTLWIIVIVACVAALGPAFFFPGHRETCGTTRQVLSHCLAPTSEVSVPVTRTQMAKERDRSTRKTRALSVQQGTKHLIGLTFPSNAGRIVLPKSAVPGGTRGHRPTAGLPSDIALGPCA